MHGLYRQFLVLSVVFEVPYTFFSFPCVPSHGPSFYACLSCLRILTFVEKWRWIEIIMVSKISQTQKEKYLTFSVIMRHQGLDRLPDRQIWRGTMAT